MIYFSSNRQSPQVSFMDAAINGLAPDGGLYFPEYIPQLSATLLQNIKTLSKDEVGLQVMQPYVDDSIPTADLQRIVSETVNFPFSLVQVNDHIFSLELFHGPTLAFKDVGARFMSRCLGYFMQFASKKVTVLVATSGDTGGAVAAGFHNVEGVEVVILYPSGKVSHVQEQQLTTLGGNITALEVSGNFDDCQRLVKEAFVDKELNEKFFLTSANSINVARWLPQQLYYFFALQQWEDEQPPVISVPSGNFGNICAGMLAYKSGLPVQHFVAACNANDAVPQFLESGIFRAQPAVATISNAMDVGNPSNFVRLQELHNYQTEAIQENLSGYRISDAETRETILRLYNQYEYLADPHGAVGYLALEKYLDAHPGSKGIFLETAHPIKFQPEVEAILGKPVPVPHSVEGLLQQQKNSIAIQPDFDAFKAFLWDRKA
jgi:threonine synthase